MASYHKSTRSTREFTHPPRENASVETSYSRGRLDFEQRYGCKSPVKKYRGQSDIFTWGGLQGERIANKRIKDPTIDNRTE